MTTRCCKKAPQVACIIFATVIFIILLSLLVTLTTFSTSSQASSSNQSISSLVKDNDGSNSSYNWNITTIKYDKNDDQRHSERIKGIDSSSSNSLPPSESGSYDPKISKNNKNDADVEFIKPFKVSVPVHEDDLLYENGGSTDTPVEFPAIGHFRHKTARFWDPHPQYELNAFGQHLHLELYRDDSFIHEDLKVTHVWHNSTQQRKEDIEDHKNLRNCYYKGVVRGDPSSKVSVNLCGGMLGHISTKLATYWIQPVETYTDKNVNVLHEIRRQSKWTSDNSHCDVGDSSTENEFHKVNEHVNISNVFDTVTTELPSNNEHSRRKRSTGNHHNHEYTIEVLVAVDRRMQEKHGNSLKEYVLTLMSTVQSIYADASIGNSINVVVVHILLLNRELVKDQHDGKGVSASAMLSSFCEMKQLEYNFPHDTAILLTREQICRTANKTNCDTLGLAELGTMCKPKSCAIVQDNGLSAAFTIAHELGHVLNMPHDDDRKCEPYRRKSSPQQNIMSRMLDQNTNPWTWSDCSRHFVTEYLEYNHGYCLLNKPAPNNVLRALGNDMLAGEKFTDSQQCELAVGPGSKICSYMPVCSRLWCTQTEFGEADGCATQHMPWADGTSCGDGRWCQKGECIPKNRHALKAIDGGWGEWSDYKECSRPCGGGVQWSTRECDAPRPFNGGKYCSGQKTRFRSCNTHDCPLDEPDFREEQCSKFDKQDQKISGIKKETKWVPKYGVQRQEECKLYCRAQSTIHYFELSPKVIDGTSCSLDRFDKCVNGVCMAAGCDNVIGSSAKELDRCGICDGRNTTCEDINGVLRYDELRHRGAHKVVTIPKGSANIEIRQIGYVNDQNYISIVDERGNYLFNKPNEIVDNNNTKLPYGGVTFFYTGAGEPIEILKSVNSRRLKRDLHIQLLSFEYLQYVSENVMTWSYSISRNDPNFSRTNHRHENSRHENQRHVVQRPSRQPELPRFSETANPVNHLVPHYHWQFTAYGDCDRPCHGRRRRTANCYEINTGKIVEEHLAPKYCSRSAKPQDEVEPCNTECKLEWEITARGECSEVCGAGVLQIQHGCVRRDLRTGKGERVDNVYCPSTSKPTPYENCYGACNDATWSYSEWGLCSSTCGGGIQKRNATCLSHVGGKEVDEKFCVSLRQQILVRRCNEDECPKWIEGEVGPCSVTCGDGIKITRFECNFRNVTVDESLCGSYPRPVLNSLQCNMGECETKKYPTSRESAEDHTYSVLVPSFRRSQYNENRISNSIEHSKQSNVRYEWKTGSWSECSKPCGPGAFKNRTVICMARSYSGKAHNVDDRYCEKAMMPVREIGCTNFRCPMWNSELWSECQTDCKRYRKVICQDHRGAISEECPIDEKPYSEENCCNIRWRSTWKPCSASCGAGVRVREIVCMKLFKKSSTNPYPRRSAKEIDPRHCAHMEKPRPAIMERPCKSRRNCGFRWVDGPWSKCSAGCGTGITTRKVICTNGSITDKTKCDESQKHLASKPCASRSHCSWRTTKWKNCTCNGFSKRRVFCYDDLRNQPSNSCDDDKRPPAKHRCTPPINCNCKSLQQKAGIRRDGEQTLNVRGRQVNIYCHNMNTHHPQEFLTLKSGSTENYSIYYSKRALAHQKCGSRKDEWTDHSITSYGTTRFNKIRLDIHSLKVIEDDFTFADIAGKPQSFGSAGDCYSNTMKCPQGDFSINLVDTKFKIRPKTTWETSGENSTINFVISLEHPYQRVRARCGGYCGSCYPSRNTSLYLELIS